MAIQINTIQEFRQYLDGVIRRAGHHAQNVQEVALPVAAAVIASATEPLKVMPGRANATGNVMWFMVNGRRYALTYRHDPSQIELLENSTQGRVIQAFTNATPTSVVQRVFSGL